ncbi:MAG: deoxyribodipyrimidine photolyase [Rhodobacteraceae bacterium]|nr:MAG: deoxyribodipyrimidine photolyase [Paracoccaceae bacterium]
MTFGPATRAEGLAHMEAFIPRMGRCYAAGRNYDRGPGQHRDVSGLSPWLRRRLVTEEEVVMAAIGAHGLEGAEKFVQEVFWRGYFKGWLERRPSVWAEYRDGLVRDLAALERDGDLQRRVREAESGTTGLGCFDAWVQELVETGYLHNHARMWFASIWIFTLHLPWRIGADFFYRHLLDGDPASNTLSWRWVAGLHTRGKYYAARSWNIAKFTGQRFAPGAGELAEVTEGLEQLEPEGLPELQPLRKARAPLARVPSLLLVTEEDGRLEETGLEQVEIFGAVRLAASHLRSPRGVADPVAEFEAAALSDIARRTGVMAKPMRAEVPKELVALAVRLGVRQVVTAYLPEGPLRDWLRLVEPLLAAEGIALCEWQREWDLAIWPHATAGFFKVKKQIPRIVAQRQLL